MMSERSDRMWKVVHLLSESGSITTSAEGELGAFADNLCDADVTIARLTTENATLRTRLHEQTQQTQDTYQQVHDAVVATLRDHNAIPDTIDPNIHPIEQVVGTCVATMRGEIDRLTHATAAFSLKARVVDRLPFCPDHRDKVAGKPCLQCEVERLTTAVKTVLREATGDLDNPSNRIWPLHSTTYKTLSEAITQDTVAKGSGEA
jgi:hypothetical protein